MESEKVKEIKEKLKECYYYLDQAYSDHLAYGGKGDEQTEEEIYFLGDILTLINELESENESCHEVLADLKTIIKQKNDLIALLEKDNELLRNSKVVYENVDYCYEDLKKAEKKLKEVHNES